MVALAGPGRRAPCLAPGEPQAMEANLLGTGHQPRHRQPALAIWHRGHRLATERQTRAVEAVDGVRGDPSQAPCRAIIEVAGTRLALSSRRCRQGPCRSHTSALRLSRDRRCRSAFVRHANLEPSWELSPLVSDRLSKRLGPAILRSQAAC